MTDRTISLRSDLVERLETLAGQQGRTLESVDLDATAWTQLITGGLEQNIIQLP